MNKIDLTNRMAEDAGISKAAAKALDSLLSGIEAGLKEDEKYLKRFGFGLYLKEQEKVETHKLELSKLQLRT